MKFDRDQFLEQGYGILRQVIPPDQLAPLRAAYEILVERQKAIWALERGPNDPPGGEWETGSSPRLTLSGMADQIDAQTAKTVEFWLHENMQGASSRLLDVEDVAVTEMQLMCSPIRDHGPMHWHRDLTPSGSAPLQGYADDILENGPRYVQWNVPLYDDDVLWVIPGSHIRFNTQAEDDILRGNHRAPLPGSVQTQLRAGDGVAYILPITHRGGDYSTKLRRTIHGGFSTFSHYPDLSYLEHLSAKARETFLRWDRQSDQMRRYTEAALRAVLAKNKADYHAQLDRLHPGRGEMGRRQSTIFLSKTARRIRDFNDPGFDNLAPRVRYDAVHVHPMTLQWGEPLADCFSKEEADVLWRRFKPVDDGVQSAQDQTSPGFQNGTPSPYYFNDVPDDLDLETLFA